MVAADRAQRPLPRRGHTPRALRRSLPRRRNQFLVLQAAPPGDLRPLGRVCPEDFEFSVKVPKVATHEHRLENVDDLLDGFLAEVTLLGEKLGPLLVQLPPSLSFSADIATGSSRHSDTGLTAPWALNPGTRAGSSPRPTGS